MDFLSLDGVMNGRSEWSDNNRLGAGEPVADVCLLNGVNQNRTDLVVVGLVQLG